MRTRFLHQYPPSRRLGRFLKSTRGVRRNHRRREGEAQAFLCGPRCRTLAIPTTDSTITIDPANVPLPPSPPMSPIALPQSDTSSPWNAPGGFLGHQSSPSPAGRKRCRRRTVSAIVLRPFVSMWHVLLSTWLWFIGDGAPVKGRGFYSLATGMIKHMRTEKPVASFTREDAVSQDVNADEQSDATLVDLDGDDDESKRFTLVELNDSDAYPPPSTPAVHTPSGSGISQDSISITSSGPTLPGTSPSTPPVALRVTMCQQTHVFCSSTTPITYKGNHATSSCYCSQVASRTK
jgi:hypothetical protein